MAGIDYSLASLQQREQFALTQSRQRQLLCWIKDQPGILGAVLLCTCNRTELYLSYFPDTAPDPVEMLCGQLHIREQTARPLFRVRQGEKEVFFHLGRLSCGAKSQIWGEDQIITQVKDVYKRQLLRLLGYPLPEYGHIPLLLDSKGQRLSKRDQSMDLGELRRRFPSPEPLLGRLGHLCGFLEKPEPVTAFDLLEVFSWEKLPKTDLRLPAVFNFLL